MTPHAFAWQQAAPHRQIWASGAALRVVFRLLPLQVPIVAGWMINALSHASGQPGSGLVHTLNTYGGILTALAVLTGITAYGSARLQKQLEGAMDGTLKQKVWDAWQSAPPSFRVDFGSDRFSMQILPYCSAAGDLAGRCAMDGLAAASRMAYPVLMLLLLDPWLALLPLGLLPLQALLAHLATSHGQRHAEAEREARRQARKLFQQSLEGVETIQALGAKSLVSAWIESAQERFEAAKENKRKYERILGSGVWGLAALGLACSWWAGAHRVAAGHISLGQLVTFAGFVGFLALPLRSFAGIARKIRNSLERLSQVQTFLASAEKARRTIHPLLPCAEPGEALRLNHVSYSAQGLPILNEVTMGFPQGEFIWIRGKSGGGKTTLLRIMAGLEAVSQGEVQASEGLIVLVPQQVEIFQTTVMANLQIANAKATQAEMWDVLTRVGLASTIRALPQGLESRLGEGLRLNSSERQKLGLARALLSHPTILLLDEATAALDEEAELSLLEELARLRPQTTIVLVAHQVRSLSGIDRVMELRDCQLKEWTTQYKGFPDERK